MPSQRAADLLVEVPAETRGIQRFSVCPGESYLSVLDALVDHQDDIEFISARHEGGASHSWPRHMVS